MTSQPSKFWLAVSVVCKLFHFESMGVTQHQGPNDDLNCAGVYIRASLVAILEQLLMYACSDHDPVQFPIPSKRWWKKENEIHLICGRSLNMSVFFALSLEKA